MLRLYLNANFSYPIIHQAHPKPDITAYTYFFTVSQQHSKPYIATSSLFSNFLTEQKYNISLVTV